jgi:hypothetical protein
MRDSKTHTQTPGLTEDVFEIRRKRQEILDLIYKNIYNMPTLLRQPSPSKN